MGKLANLGFVVLKYGGFTMGFTPNLWLQVGGFVKSQL